MSKPSLEEPATARRSFRLVGSVLSRPIQHLLSDETHVGCAPDNDLVLPVRGVSRRHASLRFFGADLMVEDLASRNGTLVNGLPVQRQVLHVGDELSFGPVSVRLELVDVGDLALGIVIDDAGPTHEDTEWLLDAPAEEPAWELSRHLAILLLGRDSRPLDEALRLLMREVGAEGGALAEWSGDGEPTMVATAGAPALPPPAALTDLFSRVLALGERAPCFRTALIGASAPLLVAAFRAPDAPLAALLLDGSQVRSGWAAASELFLRMLDSGRRAATPPAAATRPAAPLGVPAVFARCVSPAMLAVYEQIAALCRSDVAVLVLGETGVGKEHLVRLLHDGSARRRAPLLAVNCAALPSELLEAEMFGIGRGVASGVQERPGRFREADGGTLFLDEIGDMPEALQAKLLRALDSGTIVPLGCEPVQVDVRVVAATNADLRSRMQSGAFRRDLYYRLAGYELVVPPLRERREDIRVLVHHLLTRLAQRAAKRIPGVTMSALKDLVEYSWPGNVRELEAIIGRLVLVCRSGEAINSSLLPDHVRRGDGEVAADADGEPIADEEPTSDGFAKSMADYEAGLIRDALRRANGSHAGAARLLGLSRNGLTAKIARLGIRQRTVVE